ncbi:MAG: fibronectin type III domain-containing protein [Dehalococcoidia bacterium]|nr:fibronectin type III domain-containing protein [Dehalococcoidia bacterium]
MNRQEQLKPVLDHPDEGKSAASLIPTGVARPQLVYPIGGANTGGVDAPLKPVLQWQIVEDANRYELQVDTSASFFAPFVTLTDTGRLDATAYQIDKELEYSTTYYWRVRAATFTALGDWSTVGAFTTMRKYSSI